MPVCIQTFRRVTILEERERIGMDLHDGIIQSIYGVGLALENARAVLREDPESADNRLVKAMDEPEPHHPRHPYIYS